MTEIEWRHMVLLCRNELTSDVHMQMPTPHSVVVRCCPLVAHDESRDVVFVRENEIPRKRISEAPDVLIKHPQFMAMNIIGRIAVYI